ncbi:MAG: TonB-dependent receptor plug domain-containing protein, partial [Gemmatimonadetes bacterium]|nr:TonB-dependent receptor plug domain-containing protein [Gemmatimonadota bacterium]
MRAKPNGTRRSGTAFACAVLFGLPAVAVSQQDTTRTDSTRYVLEPLTIAVERERAAPPPVSAVTVDPEDVRRSQAGNPYLMLRQVSGVEVHDQGQGPGFASNVVMRGFTSDHSSDVLLVIDGVPVNLPVHGHVEGYADWNVLMPGSVSSMRVIHGGASPLYGDFALGGVVEVFTRADAEGMEGSLGVNSFGDLDGEASLGARGEDGGFFIAGQYDNQSGWRQNSDYWLGNGLLRGWHRLGSGRLEGGVSLYGTEWSSPGFVSVPRFNIPELDTAADSTDGGDSQRGVAHVRYARPVGDRGHLQAVG